MRDHFLIDQEDNVILYTTSMRYHRAGIEGDLYFKYVSKGKASPEVAWEGFHSLEKEEYNG